MLSVGEQGRDIVTVLSTGDSARLMLARSWLDWAGIRYAVAGDYVQDLFGWGRIGCYNVITGPVRVLVVSEDSFAAREILIPVYEMPEVSVPPLIRGIAVCSLLLTVQRLAETIFGLFPTAHHRP